MRLTHVRLLVDGARYADCFRFYRDTLGLTPTFGDKASGYADFAAGDTALALFGRDEQAHVVPLVEAGDSALAVFHVDDVDAEAEPFCPRVVAGPVSRPDWGIRVVYLRDPAAHLLELNQPLEER